MEEIDFSRKKSGKIWKDEIEFSRQKLNKITVILARKIQFEFSRKILSLRFEFSR